MTTHEIKCWPQFFESLLSRKKNFEVRINDRNYKVGDILDIKEFSGGFGYSGRSEMYEITYILPLGKVPYVPELRQDFDFEIVIMSIVPIHEGKS
jgi:hypothetical protein